jgi:hypothetical protein
MGQWKATADQIESACKTRSDDYFNTGIVESTDLDDCPERQSGGALKTAGAGLG